MAFPEVLAFIAFLGSMFLIIGCASSSWVVWEAGLNSKNVQEYGKVGCWQYCVKSSKLDPWSCANAWIKINSLDAQDVEIKFNIIIGFACMAAICSFLGALLILGHARGWHEQKWLAVGLHGWAAICALVAVGFYAAFRSDFNIIPDPQKSVTYAGLGFSFFLEVVGAVQCLIAACVTQLRPEKAEV